jgi:hypothetical protein
MMLDYGMQFGLGFLTQSLANDKKHLRYYNAFATIAVNFVKGDIT